MRKIPIKLTSLLAFVFFLSGFASLIYQVVWQRLLTLHYGVGAISITLIVSVYMLGLGAGALLGGFLSERIRNRIALYFVVELLIGIFGLISLPFLHYLGRYTAGSNYFLSFLYMFLFLCTPTLLMGITLPLLTKIFNSLINDFLKTVSFLYFINTLGAAIGALFASYVLISFLGLDSAVYIAVIINIVLAILIFLARYFPSGDQEADSSFASNNGSDAILGNIAYFITFITGFLAIGYEIVWFRVIGVLVKASPYAFSSVLSVYLLGIALGSLVMNRYLRRQKTVERKNLFFLLQMFIGIYVIIVFIGYYYLTKYTAFSSFTRSSFSNDLHPSFLIPSFQSLVTFFRDLYVLGDVFFWPMIFVFVPTVLMGASFPLISSLALTQKNKEGKTIGVVYFFNICGNVFGGLLTGFMILPHLGTENTLVLFSSIGVFLGLFISKFAGKRFPFILKVAAILILMIVNVTLFPKSGRLYKAMHISPGEEFQTYVEEGIDGVIVTYQYEDIVRNFISGLTHGGRPGYEYYNKVIEAIRFTPKLNKVLIIGYGTGSFSEAVLRLEEVQKVTVVEISKTLIKNLKKMTLFREMLDDSRLDLIIDDARRYLLRTHENYDLILMDPLRTTTSYSNNLYSRQFFDLASNHLNDDGIILLYTDEIRVLPKTLFSIFDKVRLYQLQRNLTSYFCIASKKPFERNYKMERDLMDSFSSREQETILEFCKKYLGNQDYIQDKTNHYPINQDWKPVCEYYLGLKLKEKLFLRR